MSGTSRLEPLAPLLLVLPEKREPGPPPRMEWLPLAALRIDPAYQRPIRARGRRTIAAIVAGFAWNRFQPVLVAPVPGHALFTLIDGQHRAIAALTLGYEKIPAVIVKCAPAEAAAIFAAVNGTVTPMQPLSLYKAALAAGETWAHDIRRICGEAGIEVLTYPVTLRTLKPRQTQAVGTLRHYWQKLGPQAMAERLTAAAAAPGADEPGFWKADAVRDALEGRLAGKAVKVDTTEANLATIRDMKARGQSRETIAAVLKVPYALIERALGESRR